MPTRSKATTDYIYDSAELLADPAAVFDRVRADGDLVWCPALRRWLVLSKPAATEALGIRSLQVYDLFRAFQRIAQRSGVDLTDLTRICDWIPFLHDGPRHEQLRAFFARVLADIQGDYLASIESSSRRLLGRLVEQGEGCFARDYADRLHIEALGCLVGFPETERAWIAAHSSSQGSIDFAASIPEMLAANARAGALLRRIARFLEAPECQPFMKRIARHLAATGCGESPIHRLEALTALILLGRDTLAGTLSVGLAEMLDQNGGVLTSSSWRQPGYGVDELVRLSSTVQIVNRIATEPVWLAGQEIATGDLLMIFLPAANRDPASFTCPHAFAENRGAHIAFGARRHLCVGMPISRAAVEVALCHLAAIPEVRSMPGRVIDTSKNTRKFKNLPIRLPR